MGALTLKVFSNELREWEYTDLEAIDPTNSFGVSLKLSCRENQIFLAEPNDPDMPWITDKARLFFDGMFTQNTNKEITSWNQFFQNFFDLLYFVDYFNFQKKKTFFLTFIFENLSIEVSNILYLLQQTSSLLQIRKLEAYNIKNDLEINYQLTHSIKKPSLSKSTTVLLLNTNPRYEGYLLNLNLRQRFFKGNFKVLSLGPTLNLTFSTINLGSNFNTFKSIIEGVHVICQDFKNSNHPILITNTELLKKNDSKLLFTSLQKINSPLKTLINVLNHNLNNVGVHGLYNFLPLSLEDFKNSFGFYFINVPMQSSANLKRFLKLYLFNSFSSSNQNATVIPQTFVDQYVDSSNKDFAIKFKNKFNYYYLPTNLFLEESETFINTQGIVKRTTKLLSFKKNVKSNWQIIRKIFLKIKSVKFFNQTKDFNTINFDVVNSFNFKNYLIFNFYATQTFTTFSFYLTKQNNPYFDIRLKSEIKVTKTKMFKTKLKNWLDDFFTGNGKDSFSYNSSVLMNCSKISRISSSNFF